MKSRKKVKIGTRTRTRTRRRTIKKNNLKGGGSGLTLARSVLDRVKSINERTKPNRKKTKWENPDKKKASILTPDEIKAIIKKELEDLEELWKKMKNLNDKISKKYQARHILLQIMIHAIREDYKHINESAKVTSSDSDADKEKKNELTLVFIESFKDVFDLIKGFKKIDILTVILLRKTFDLLFNINVIKIKQQEDSSNDVVWKDIESLTNKIIPSSTVAKIDQKYNNEISVEDSNLQQLLKIINPGNLKSKFDYNTVSAASTASAAAAATEA